MIDDTITAMLSLPHSYPARSAFVNSYRLPLRDADESCSFAFLGRSDYFITSTKEFMLSSLVVCLSVGLSVCLPVCLFVC